MVEAWSLAQGLGAPGGRGAVVALLDSGVAYERRGRYRRAPDLRRSTFVRPYDFIEKDRHPNDVFGHGTHVAGTIAQTTNNGVGTAGIAYNAKIMPLRVLDSNGEGDSAAIARAIRYAARYRADVINLSLEFPAEVRAAEIPDVLAAIRYAHRRGSVVVAAAGNQADIAVAYPARAQSVIAVGATTITGCQADYSNAGEDLDLVAPGGGADAPNTDSVWDSAHCSPDSVGRPIVQQTFTRGRHALRAAAQLRGHLDGGAARLGDRGARDRDEAARGRTRARAQVEAHLEATARPTDRPDRYGAGLVDAARRSAEPQRRRVQPPLRRPDDHHAAGSVMRDLVRHAPEQEALGAGHALVADHDQVGALLLGDVEDRVGRVALARVSLHVDARLAQ